MRIVIVTNEKIYSIGNVYSFDSVSPFVTPKSFSDIWDSIRHNVSADIQRVKNWCRYKVEAITESLVEGKRFYVVTFLVIFGLSLHNLFPARTSALPAIAAITHVDTCVATPTVALKKEATKKRGAVKAKPKIKKIKVKAPSLFASVLKDSIPMLEASTLVFKPNYLEYQNTYKENLPSPTSDPKYKKFSSYEDAVIYLFYLGKLHNIESPQKINVLSMLFQSGIEMGLRPSSGGYVSRMATFGYNPLGLKTFDENDEFMYAKDDDYKAGKKIHSKFKIFPNFAASIDYYANLVAKPRYTGKVSTELVYKVKGKTGVTICYPDVTPYTADQYWLQYIKELRHGGYCTSNSYINQVKVTASEMLPVLKKHGLI